MRTQSIPDYFSFENKKKWSILRNKKLAIITTQWHPEIVNSMCEKSKKLLTSLLIEYKVVQAPGSYELPYYAKRLLSSYDAVIALGCVLKGETIHFEMISLSTTINLSQVSIQEGKPIGYGLLTVNTYKQALARSGDNANNEGLIATAAVLDMLVEDEQLF